MSHRSPWAARGALALCLAAVVVTSRGALAEEGPAEAAPAPAATAKPADATPADAPTPAEKKAAYALPFSMRPAVAANLVRVDSAFAFQNPSAGAKQDTYVSTLTAGYKPISSIPDLGFYVRAAWVHNSPDGKDSADAVSNPLFFGMYTPEIAPHLRLALFAGVTAPIGAGGGNTPNATTRATILDGIYARQAMDNALFATNYTTPTGGVGLAWIDHGFTAQVEATVLYLIRTRGELQDTDSSRVNFTSGASVGYLLFPFLTAQAELHYQRWLSTPAVVAKDDTKRDQATGGFALRANVPLSKTMIIRPGLGYFAGFDDPMHVGGYRIVQLDVPIAF